MTADACAALVGCVRLQGEGAGGRGRRPRMRIQDEIAC